MLCPKQEVLEQDVGLPRTRETIDHYANLAGVDFRGAPGEIIDGADDIAYLDFQGGVARTDDMGVQLGPAAFQDARPYARPRERPRAAVPGRTRIVHDRPARRRGVRRRRRLR